MRRKINYILGALTVLFFIAWILSDSNEKEEDFSEIVKVSLREVGDQLLLSNNDSTSLVLPVVKLSNHEFQLSFDENLTFEPDNLVTSVKNSFLKSDLSNYYRVEVIQCSDKEVAYSYEVKNESEKDIIPCGGRLLPQNCYTIEFKFINKKGAFFNKETILFLLISTMFLLLISIFYKRKQVGLSDEENSAYATLGSFQFYPEQNKLVKKAIEINLSKKECELLEIFVANPNQIVKRDELTKKVWEDNGVIVGRSLDTYISKLRKKLKDDDSIKLTNVHGVGYKLEIKL